MIGWLKNLNDASRLVSINEASRISGIPVKALEKDWWVTLTLKLILIHLMQTILLSKVVLH
jgi:hypothetical protein